MADDEVEHTEYDEAAEQRQQSVELGFVGHDQRQGDEPNEAQDSHQPGLGEQVEQRIMGLEIRRGAQGRMVHEFGLVRCVSSPFSNKKRYFKMRARSQPQHGGFYVTVNRLTPGGESYGRRLLRLDVIALGH